MVLRVCAFFALATPSVLCLRLLGFQPAYPFITSILLEFALAVILGLATLHSRWKRTLDREQVRPGTITAVVAWLSVFTPIHGYIAWFTPLAGRPWPSWLQLVPFVPVCVIAFPILFAAPEDHPIRGYSRRNHA